MNKKIDLIIKNGKVFYKNKFQIINVIVNKGKILEISNNIKSYEAKKIIDGRTIKKCLTLPLKFLLKLKHIEI